MLGHNFIWYEKYGFGIQMTTDANIVEVVVVLLTVLI
jgi:hypothetical protein